MRADARRSILAGALGVCLAAGNAGSARADDADDAARCGRTPPTARDEKIVSPRPTALISAGAGGYVGGAYDASLGSTSSDPTAPNVAYGFDAFARADIAALSPLWLSGSARLFSGAGARSIHLDAVAGLNLRTYGHRWIPRTIVVDRLGSVVDDWAGHCQLRRDDVSLIGGVKTIVVGTTPASKLEAKDVLAIQAGVQELFRAGNKSLWSATALYDPARGGIGGQATIWAPLGNPWVNFGTHFLVMHYDAGWIGLFTLDIGTTIEL